MHFTIPYASKMLPRAKLFFITPTQFCKPITPPSCHFCNSAREDTDCVNILQDACLEKQAEFHASTQDEA